MQKSKVILVITISILLTSYVSIAHAVTPTTESSDVIDKLKQIEILKEKIATKVAEIRDSEKAGKSGNVKKIDKNTLTITTKKGDQTVYVSEDTEIYSLAKAEKTKIKSSDVSVGDKITALGYLDTDKTSLNAKYVYLMPNTISLSGKISQKDAKNFTVSLETNEGQTVTVDIETYTKTYAFNTAQKTLEKSGFSKLNTGDIIRLIGTPNAKEDNRVSATRIWKKG